MLDPARHLAALCAEYERRAQEAATVHATAPLAEVYRAVLADLTAYTTPDISPAPVAPPPEDHWLSLKDTAARLGVSVRTLRRHADDYPFFVTLPGGRPRVSAVRLQRWMHRRAN